MQSLSVNPVKWKQQIVHIINVKTLLQLQFVQLQIVHLKIIYCYIYWYFI